MKKLNVTRKHFNESKYFQEKYGKLQFVSESGKLFKTDKGQILKFKESFNKDDFNILPKREQPKFDIGEYVKLNRNFFYRHVDIEKLKPNGWEVEDVKEISGGFKYYVVNSDYFDDEDDEQKGFWVWDDEIKKDSKGKFKEAKKFGKKFYENHEKGEHLYSVIVKKPGGWDGSFQVNAMNGDEALEKAKARLGRGSRILRIEDIGEYKAFDADDYAGFDESSDGGWFDEKYGFLQKDIPEECVMDCSGPGRKDDAVAYWVDELKFYIPQPLIGKAKNYLREFGAWEEEELDQWAETEDVEHQLAQHILWCFCCDLREGNVEPGELYLGH